MSPILGAGHERTQIQGNHATVEQVVRHLGADDPLSQTLDDRRLADARLTDEHRIVLGPAAEDLEHSFDLVAPTDDGIERALLGHARQVPPKFIERRGVALAIALARRTLAKKCHG